MRFSKEALIFLSLMIAGENFTLSSPTPETENCLEGASTAVFMPSKRIISLNDRFKGSEICIGAGVNQHKKTSEQDFIVAVGAHEEREFSHDFDDLNGSLKNIALEIFENPSDSKELIAERDFSEHPKARALHP